MEALEKAIMVLSSKETRFLLAAYCEDRRNGMSAAQACASDYQPLWNLITGLQGVPQGAILWRFEQAHLSYRLVGYADSYEIRTQIGKRYGSAHFAANSDRFHVSDIRFRGHDFLHGKRKRLHAGWYRGPPFPET